MNIQAAGEMPDDLKVGYLSEQILRFVAHLNQREVNYYLEVLPTRGHSRNRGLNESLAIMIQNVALEASSREASLP